MNETATAHELISHAKRIVVIQAENPDGDSLGSSLALEEILGDLGKEVSLHCPVDVPKYLRYVSGWDRVTLDFDHKADLAILVDTVSETLLSKTLEIPGARHFLETHPVIVIDHHGEVESSLSFDHTFLLDEKAVATGEALYRIAAENKWPINPHAAESMLIAMLSDSLGFTTPNTTADSFFVASKLIELGAEPASIEIRRREYMKKSAEILQYKGRLLERIEYALEGSLAIVHIPWEDIQAYSDQYNPSVLVLDEMRMVYDVQVAVAIKTYPDGKATGKLRTNTPVADKIAGFFGGGGHKYAAGFRIYESYDTLRSELVAATDKILKDHTKDAEAL